MPRAVRCFVRLVLVVTLFVCGLTTVAQAQSSWDRYRPGTLAAMIQRHDSTIRADHDPKLPSLVVSGENFPTVARVTYCGDSRPLDSKRRDVMRRWGLAFHRDTSIVTDFQREYLFQEGTRLHWLPVQDTVASFFPGELKPGQAVGLYVMWIGAYYAGAEIVWTFIVNEYDAGPAGPGCDATGARRGRTGSPEG